MVVVKKRLHSHFSHMKRGMSLLTHPFSISFYDTCFRILRSLPVLDHFEWKTLLKTRIEIYCLDIYFYVHGCRYGLSLLFTHLFFLLFVSYFFFRWFTRKFFSKFHICFLWFVRLLRHRKTLLFTCCHHYLLSFMRKYVSVPLKNY
jgi:hypothetical protein